MKNSIGLAVFIVWISSHVCAQGVLTPKPKEPYVAGETSLFGYYEYLPSNYDADSTARFPLLIYLSGFGSKGDGINDLNIVLEEGVARLINDGLELPLLVMTPQSWSGFWRTDDLDTYLNFILDRYRVDPNRVYITGFSSGGLGTFSYAEAFPEKVTAIIPVSGKGDHLDICRAADVAVWAFHNVDDTVYSYQYSALPISTLNLCDPVPVPKAKVTVYPGGGHDAWNKTYDGSGMGTEDPAYDAFDMDVFDWLLQFAKDTIIVDAGDDQVIFRPQTGLQIKASAASHDGLHTYAWTQLEGPELALGDQADPVLDVKDMAIGEYIFSVTATDNLRRSASDTVKVRVRPPNAPPTVDTGKEQTVILPIDSVTLIGAATDPENDAISLVWEQEAGPADAILQFDSARYDSTWLVVKNVQAGEYTFRLIATDAYDSVGTHKVKLRVLSPPETIRDFPYVESFEQSNAPGWQGYGINSSWEQGIPASSVINTASDGDQAWVTNLTGEYQAHESSFLLSPVFDFSVLTSDPTIKYDFWQHTAPEDRVQLSVTTDQGVTWEPYDLKGEDAVTNDNNGWVSVSRTLEGLAGQKSVVFRVELEALGMERNEGIAFDHVIVCSMGTIATIPDTLVIEGETLSIPLTLDNADVAEVAYQAISSKQEVLPDENITVSGNVLEITSPFESEGETEITVFSQDYCVNETSFTLTVARVTAIGESDSGHGILYPNPGKGYYQLETEHPISEVRLYGLEGQFLKKYNEPPPAGKSLSVDISDQPDGIYYLQVETNREVVTHKLIKQ